MSLLDALLSEKYRDPREIWISLQPAGAGGANDPFYGGVTESAPLNATLSLAVGTDPREITVTTESPHSYLEGDIIVLSGALAPAFDGPYYVFLAGLPANQFKCFLDIPAINSFTGTALSVKRTFLLDLVLRNLTLTNVVIHFGPGVYETRGNAGSQNVATQGWKTRLAWKIRGSGIDVTTIKLASSRGAPGLYQYTVIGAQNYDQLADYSEVSDLTVDCNAEGNRSVTVGAIFLIGSHTRARRVRAINWGPQAGPESFVISLAGENPYLPETTDCVIEDCIANQPGLNNTHETTVLGFTGAPTLPEVMPSFFRGCVMRRNFVDATYSRNEVPIESITLASPIAIVTTARPHHRMDGDWVVIAGAIVNGTELNAFNGSYPISNRTDTSFEYTPSPFPGSNPVGAMYVDRFSSHYIQAGNNSIVAVAGGPANQYCLTTLTPHNRIPGSNVVIGGVNVALVEYANAFNDTHLIDEVVSPTVLKFTVHPTTEKPTGNIQYGPNVFPKIGVQIHVGVGGGTCQVVEHNQIIGATVGMYTDSFSTKSLHIRNNHFHQVRTGVFKNLGNYLSPSGPNPGSCLTCSLDGTIATFTTILPHGLSMDDAVIIGGAFVPYFPNPYNNPNNPYNGAFTVSAVPSPNQFQYVLKQPFVTPEVRINAGGSPVFSVAPSPIAIQATSLTRDPAKKKIATFTTAVPHGFKAGDIVSIFGAQMISSQTPPAFLPTYYNPYNGLFVIDAIEPVAYPTWFTYSMLSEAPDNVRTDGLDGVALPQCAKQVGTALTRNGTEAMFHTVRPHFLEVGQIVNVSNAIVQGSNFNPFNGSNFRVTSVESTSFCYEMGSIPATLAYGAAGYSGKDIEGLLQIENNVFELVTMLDPTGPLLSAGAVGMGGGELVFPPNSVFRQVAVRGNLVRHVDTALDIRDVANAFLFFNAGAVLIENNVIALNRTWPIAFDKSEMISCVNNLRPDGTLVQAYDLATGRAANAYFRAAEEALILAVF